MEESKQALAEASGITDDTVLEKLAELNIGADTLAALALVPLIEIAWADGNLDEKEKQAVLAAAEDSGLSKKTLNYELLENWLGSPPERTLREAWRRYIEALCGKMTQQERTSLEANILGRARAVAEAGGGYLGLVAKVSQSEARILKELEEAFRAEGGDDEVRETHR